VYTFQNVEVAYLMLQVSRHEEIPHTNIHRHHPCLQVSAVKARFLHVKTNETNIVDRPELSSNECKECKAENTRHVNSCVTDLTTSPA
jgi:hypothetical protein